MAIRVHPLFSDIDSDLRLLTWRLNTYGYAIRSPLKNRLRPDGRRLANQLAHRLVLERMLGRPPSSQELGDHINRNKLDNRRSNLCVVTPLQNSQNRSCSSFRGAHYDSSRNKWVAKVSVNNRQLYLGRFDTRKEAAEVAAEKRRELGFHGEPPVNASPVLQKAVTAGQISPH